MNSKIHTIGIALFFLVITLSCTNAQKEKEATKEDLPNILLLMGDDYGWAEMGPS